ncbi:unnamed protein product (macronuclear) [Paramecium tetraurelia]|uniref:Uncharacterized protein n=1 Tax=Paramecium tetraurelia TaxID=5888 RepID=A0DUI5_PARTE|nr:uncharacterized protein GSPATT00020374001 [Paramecium tetraurelia]CAK86702.1 unnamed protein product [Paramecium tetraurelia]|eukprot:XP_001454099.1 hypothetical protein (macronuclear) [Paramecium tetraurelia strain d4-2]
MIKPRMCHLSYKPVESLKFRTLDFVLLELEKINFSVKRNQMAEKFNNEQEIRTPTFKTHLNQNQSAVKEIANDIQAITPKRLIKSKRNYQARRKVSLRNPKI